MYDSELEIYLGHYGPTAELGTSGLWSSVSWKCLLPPQKTWRGSPGLRRQKAREEPRGWGVVMRTGLAAASECLGTLDPAVRLYRHLDLKIRLTLSTLLL